MQDWPGNTAAAVMIFKHLGFPYYAGGIHGEEMTLEGKRWGKLFLFTCPRHSRTIEIQILTPKTNKDQGSIILGSCGLLDLTEKGVANILIPTGKVSIGRWGVHVTIK